ncbi:MAG: glycosyltransferase family 39 protein [Chloroflexi bacterium]|nr:glycosyltransferase family 39 protein [Chloroflexota bacterium]
MMPDLARFGGRGTVHRAPTDQNAVHRPPAEVGSLAGLRPTHLALLALILLLAFALRVYRLDGQSLWSDEGASAVMATRSLWKIIENAAADIHPPLYYFVLRGWSPLAGTGEFALRFPSLFFGVLSVALVLTLASRLFGSKVGIVSGFAATASPLLVYYSQEARMYALMAFLALLSTYLFLRLTATTPADKPLVHGRATPLRVSSPSMGEGRVRVKSEDPPHLNPLPRRGEETQGLAPPTLLGHALPLQAAYVLVTAALLYTQYFSITIILFQNLVFLAAFWRLDRHWRRWLEWIGAQAAVGLLFLPWFLKVSGQVGAWETSVSPPFLYDMLRISFAYLSLGPSWLAARHLLPVFGALLLAGLLWVLVSRGALSGRLRNLLVVSLYVLLPVLAMYLISRQRPMFHHKFLMLAAPAFAILLGLGVASLATVAFRVPGPALLRRLAVAGVAVALAFPALATVASLQAYYFEPRFARDDYRGLARYIEASSGPEDAIILNAPGQIEIFDYYYRGALPRHPLPHQRPIDVAATESELEQIAARQSNIWLVLWGANESDPDRAIEMWLNNHAYRTFSRWFGGVELVAYTVQTSPVVTGLRPLDVNFGEGIRLAGYEVVGDRPSEAGHALRLVLQWEAKSATKERYKVFTHIIDRNSYLWGQHDAEPQGGAKPTVDWRPGDSIQDRHGLAISLGTPPGDYYIEVGLYDPATGKRLPVIDKGKVTGDSVLLGPVRIARPQRPVPPERLSFNTGAGTLFGRLRLAGYTLSKVGTDGARSSFAKGEVALLALHWQALEKPGSAYRLRLELRGATGQPVFAWEGEPTEGVFPTNLWDKGEIVLDQHRIPLTTPPGQYDLLLGVSDGNRPVNPSGGKAPESGEFIRLERITVQ